MTAFDKAHCEKLLWAMNVDVRRQRRGLFLQCLGQGVSLCVCVCVCLTCDPWAALAAYGSNWAARKLTKCQWSVVPQEVINCVPRG